MEPPSDDDLTVTPTPRPEAGDPTVPPPPTPEMRQLEEATAAERDEVRRMVDAGAASPQDLRALAEKIKAQREREDEVWRSEVRPSLKKSKKRRFMLSDLKDERDEDRSAERRFLILAGVAVVLVLVVLTLSSAPVVVIAVLLVGLLVYAYVTGRRPPEPEDPPDEPAT